MKLLFHCHTDKSPCSDITESELIKFLDKNKFDAVVVTDHNNITSINWPNGTVIPASEIATSEGDVIGIFIKENIPKGLSISKTSDLIHSQGGLVVAAHPCDTIRKEAMGYKSLINNIDSFDIIETYNSRNIFNRANQQARIIAKLYNVPGISGSDAHTIGELSNTFMTVQKLSTPAEFIESLKKASVQNHPSGLIPHIKTFFIKRSVRQQKRQQ